MWFNSQKLFVGSTPLPLHNSSCKVPYTLLQNSCGEKTVTFLETVIFTLIKRSQINICKCFTWVKFIFQVNKISISLSPTCMNNLLGRGQG